MKPVYAIVLAGDSEDRKIMPGSVVANKAFVPINGRRMVDYVLDCYKSVKELAGIGIIGPAAELSDIDGVTISPAGRLNSKYKGCRRCFPAWVAVTQFL